MSHPLTIYEQRHGLNQVTRLLKGSRRTRAYRFAQLSEGTQYAMLLATKEEQ